MITTENLRELLLYEPDTGLVRRRNTLRIIGSAHSGGYIETQVKGKRFFLHRLAWQLFYGDSPDGQIDHVNGDRADNRISNLRLANQQQNSANMKIRPNNKAGLKGVVIDKRNGAVRAYIHVNYTTKYLGTFDNPQEAHEAYLTAAKGAFADFSRAE